MTGFLILCTSSCFFRPTLQTSVVTFRAALFSTNHLLRKCGVCRHVHPQQVFGRRQKQAVSGIFARKARSYLCATRVEPVHGHHVLPLVGVVCGGSLSSRACSAALALAARVGVRVRGIRTIYGAAEASAWCPRRQHRRSSSVGFGAANANVTYFSRIRFGQVIAGGDYLPQGDVMVGRSPLHAVLVSKLVHVGGDVRPGR